MNKIQVTQPTFLINLDNPTETSYVPMEGNWKTITSPTYLNGFPEIKDDEILYIYKNNRGYIYKNNIGYIAKMSTNNEKYNQIIDDVYKSYVKSFFGPHSVFLSSTINGYEGTGRSLSLKLIQ
jgi:hypothetical protein